MPSVYDKLNIRFQYPENWNIETDDVASDKQAVSVYSPGGAFWTVVTHRNDANPEEIAETALHAMREEYDELDSETVSEEILGIKLIGYDLNFYCLDLTNSAWIRVGGNAKVTYLIICQAEDREFAKVSPVFQAMITSLLSK